MTTLLTLRRNAPVIPPARFIAMQPGCWLHYADDTATNDPTKTYAAPTFVLPVARRQQCQRCGVFFTLQAFGNGVRRDQLLGVRNLGVAVRLVKTSEAVNEIVIDQRKEAYLLQRLHTFRLRPHWLTETRHGFEMIWRLQPQRDPLKISVAEAIQHRLVARLQGEHQADVLLQTLRVPGTLQCDCQPPFHCRLLRDDSTTIAPYSLIEVEQALNDNEPPTDAPLNWPRLPSGPVVSHTPNRPC